MKESNAEKDPSGDGFLNSGPVEALFSESFGEIESLPSEFWDEFRSLPGMREDPWTDLVPVLVLAFVRFTETGTDLAERRSRMTHLQKLSVMENAPSVFREAFFRFFFQRIQNEFQECERAWLGEFLITVPFLISFSGENTMISLEDCLRVCSRNTETLSWEFSSALASRNAAKAISMIPGIIETLEQERGSSGGRAELALISSANSEFKNLLSAKCEAERFSIPAHANADYFYSLFESRKGAENNSPFFSLHPFRAFKLWENSTRFTDVEISRAFAAIFTANKQMVTGGDMRLALETLVIKIAGT